MADDGLTVEVVNLEDIMQALLDAPDESAKLFKERLTRFNRTMKSRFIRRRMRGQGIKWSGVKSVGGNVRTKVVGTGMALQASTKLSRFLSIHERGGLIVPKKGAYLTTRSHPGGKAQGLIRGRVKSVMMRARLGFLPSWEAQVKAETPRWPLIAQRAIRMAMQRRVKSVSAIVNIAIGD